ncbi:hypothetical protein [Streptomyces sp. SLBN-115]|uniref:hypothetical protein n=1 Tax=Streptomyces sp. SLBN-115 TaxID=2768453 RepID=UPI0011542A64|nr:hypothetical protein [Streptomyces sp. SLBN-115]TQJ47344.1 hypothetical protein FBY34_6770 [Streptomyces sp. SLBN-115]
MMGSADRNGSGRPRVVRRALFTHGAAALLIVLALAAALASAVTGRAAAADGDTVKVFVVQTAGGDTLESIAARTLGSSSRAEEIFDLNRGLAQPDGGALTTQGDALRTGWILRLPEDAAGPDVQLAQETGAGSETVSPATPPQQAAPGDTAGQPDSATVVVPLPALLAVAGAVLLALVTAAILARKRVRSTWRAFLRQLRRLGEPARRRRRLRQRVALSARFSVDADPVRRAYAVLGEFAGSGSRPETAVHAVRVDAAGATVWLEASAGVPASWQQLDSARWRRQAADWPGRGADTTTTARTASLDGSACLVRVGIDEEGAPLLVDLSRLDGVLSVTGDAEVGRAVVSGLLAELARSRPEIPVTLRQGAEGGAGFALPAGLREPTESDRHRSPGDVRGAGTVRAGAVRRPVRGVVVVAGTPTRHETAELLELCGPGGAGWTGLVCGDLPDARWRWHAEAEGSVELPLLGVKVTAPA